jgi:carbonic anhydrase
VAALRTGEHPPGNLAYLVEEIAPAVWAAGPDHPDVQARATRGHVARTVRRLEGVELLSAATAAGRVALAGAVYDLDTGRVTVV